MWLRVVLVVDVREVVEVWCGLLWPCVSWVMMVVVVVVVKVWLEGKGERSRTT